MTVHCGACNHEWTFDLPLPMELGKAGREMKAFAAKGCPACQSGDVICGPRKWVAPDLPDVVTKVELVTAADTGIVHLAVNGEYFLGLASGDARPNMLDLFELGFRLTEKMMEKRSC